MYRGTTAQHSTYTGPVGEITVDVDKDTLVVHDGTTPGGHPLAKAATTITASNGISVTSGGTLGANTAIAGVDATTSAKGVVQVGDNITVSSGTISVKPWADSEADHTNINVADYQEGAIIVTDEPVTAGATAVIAEVEQTVTSSTNKVPSSKAVQDAFNGAVPVGTIIWSGAATVPAGYLLCNGSAVGRTTYPELFAAIGTTFGPGDGSTTFNLPNLIGKFIEGANAAGTVKAAGLPNIEGTLCWVGCQTLTSFRGAIYATGQDTPGYSHSGSGYTSQEVGFDASRSSAIYGNSTTVQPPAVTALPCIKAFSGVIGSATVVAGQLVNDIQGKVNLDGSNTSSIGSTLSTFMAHAAMPSGQYIDLTLPASGGTVTAPADGWLQLSGRASSNVWRELALLNPNNISLQFYVFPDAWGHCHIPVSKNNVVTVTYSTDSANTLRFFYANGTATA
jgi:hypothetical protein